MLCRTAIYWNFCFSLFANCPKDWNIVASALPLASNLIFYGTTKTKVPMRIFALLPPPATGVRTMPVTSACRSKMIPDPQPMLCQCSANALPMVCQWYANGMPMVCRWVATLSKWCFLIAGRAWRAGTPKKCMEGKEGEWLARKQLGKNTEINK